MRWKHCSFAAREWRAGSRAGTPFDWEMGIVVWLSWPSRHCVRLRVTKDSARVGLLLLFSMLVVIVTTIIIPSSAENKDNANDNRRRRRGRGRRRRRPRRRSSSSSK